MLNITIKTVPHSDQRYETVGDWHHDGKGKLNIIVSDMGNQYRELLVGIHELVEASLCMLRGIPESTVTEFDIKYEKERDPLDITSEPGDHPNAPYKKEHRFAENIERMICHEMGISWSEYEKTVYSL